MGEHRVLLSLEIGPLLTTEPGIFACSHLVDGLAQVAQDMEPVKEDRRLRSVIRLERRGAKDLPHVHHRLKQDAKPKKAASKAVLPDSRFHRQRDPLSSLGKNSVGQFVKIVSVLLGVPLGRY